VDITFFAKLTPGARTFIDFASLYTSQFFAASAFQVALLASPAAATQLDVQWLQQPSHFNNCVKTADRLGGRGELVN